ncbi:MAG: hypothetical protein KME19_19085 [Microcoleus vaginatus WJT46-NPBG5]|nr:hypothetical protein [Microcoleus vaginatus WJT46-NPBG5]
MGQLQLVLINLTLWFSQRAGQWRCRLRLKIQAILHLQGCLLRMLRPAVVCQWANSPNLGELYLEESADASKAAILLQEF